MSFNGVLKSCTGAFLSKGVEFLRPGAQTHQEQHKVPDLKSGHMAKAREAVRAVGQCKHSLMAGLKLLALDHKSNLRIIFLQFIWLHYTLYPYLNVITT